MKSDESIIHLKLIPLNNPSEKIIVPARVVGSEETCKFSLKEVYKRSQHESLLDKDAEIKYLSTETDSEADNSIKGGDSKVWKAVSPVEAGDSLIETEEWCIEQIMGWLKNDLRKFNRLSCPIKLNPKEATFDDVALHALLRQRLSPSTVEKNLRYAQVHGDTSSCSR